VAEPESLLRGLGSDTGHGGRHIVAEGPAQNVELGFSFHGRAGIQLEGAEGDVGVAAFGAEPVQRTLEAGETEVRPHAGDVEHELHGRVHGRNARSGLASVSSVR
jgi:hypothetical protein